MRTFMNSVDSLSLATGDETAKSFALPARPKDYNNQSAYWLFLAVHKTRTVRSLTRLAIAKPVSREIRNMRQSSIKSSSI